MSAPNITFDDAVAESYDRYLVPLIFDDYARDLALRLRLPLGARVLETAAGTGALTRHLKALLPSGSSLESTDLNPDMLALAERKLEWLGGIRFGTADATNLPHPDASFDAVVCQFGVMFWADGARGYHEASRVLRHGGVFAFNIWDSLAHNRLPQLAHETVAQLFPEDPPQFLTMPFGALGIDTIKGYLDEAGFDALEVVVQPRISRAPSAHHVAMGFLAGTPLGAVLAEKGVLERSIVAVERAVVAEFGPGPVIAPMQAIRFVARKR